MQKQRKVSKNLWRTTSAVRRKRMMLQTKKKIFARNRAYLFDLGV